MNNLKELANEPQGIEKRIIEQYERMKDREIYKDLNQKDMLELASKIVTTEYLSETTSTLEKALRGIENSIGYI